MLSGNIFRLRNSAQIIVIARGDSVSEIKLRSAYNYSPAGCSLERKKSHNDPPQEAGRFL